MRLMSHSKGPRMVSSKSLMSKTRRPSGAAKAPRLRTWASPQSWVWRPVLGPSARSAAMRGTAPRKKPKGEAAMRSYLMETSAGTRPRVESARSLSGSVLRWEGCHPAWSARRMCLR